MDESDPKIEELDGPLSKSEAETAMHSSEEQAITKVQSESSQIFSESPVYEPEDEWMDESENQYKNKACIEISDDDQVGSSNFAEKASTTTLKRRLSCEDIDRSPKIQKLNDLSSDVPANSQVLDEEKTHKDVKADVLKTPSSFKVQTPIRSSPRRTFKRIHSSELSSPRKISKRSNSSEASKTPKTPKRNRSASADSTLSDKTPDKMAIQILKPISEEKPLKINLEDCPSAIIVDEKKRENSDPDSCNSRPSVEFVEEIRAPIKSSEIIASESTSDINDSQNIHLVFSPTLDDDENSDNKQSLKYNSDEVVPKNRLEVINAGKVDKSHSEGYNYSDGNNYNSQIKLNESKGNATDQESTDSVCTLSPDHIPNVASKLIKKLSHKNSSTPTESSEGKHTASDSSNNTPDNVHLNMNKNKKAKNESFRVSNTTTPSTISPLPNGHSLPITTPQTPTFEVHMTNNEDGEFLSLYVIRIDNDLGIDMCKEYQRFSKRFSVDPYLADVSVNNSPSSVTSVGMVNLPNRISCASTVSSTSTSSSNRTSDGAFIVPQNPRKSVLNPTSSVKGYDQLMKKIQDMFSHIREFSIDDVNQSSNDDKVSIAVQTIPVSDSNSMSNGNASPIEISKCDKVTPKSSLKKTRVRGRRPMAGKTKRAILPTQVEETEYMLGLNSPEMVSVKKDTEKTPVKSTVDEKPLSSLVGTPKSVSKLKQKKIPTSPRPATPVEKPVVNQEYSGHPPGTVVLARWVDRRYYSGKVIEVIEPNRYLIKFDDGQSKALIDDFIIFGDMKRLPLQGQSVYALVDEEQNYEPGLVLSIEENNSGTITYRCTTDGDTVVMVTASELYLTDDQARSLKEPSTPLTPRRRVQNRELDLDNIIQGPRSARTREKGNSDARRRVNSPKSPKASTSGLKPKVTTTPIRRKRAPSESSELSESSNSAPPARLEEVAGVEPEVQKTPKKIDGVKAGPLQLKGAARQNVVIGKKNSKLTKFENDADTVKVLGPIPESGSKLFAGICFLLTCTEQPKKSKSDKTQENRHYSSEEDGETSVPGTDTEDLEFSDRPFNKERLREQLEAGGGTVYSHFDVIPKSKYSVCKLIAPRPCLTAKYIQSLAANIPAVVHTWVIMCCTDNTLLDLSAYVLPAGFSILQQRFVPWTQPSSKRSQIFKDKVILLCGDPDTFVKFWERVCTFVGATTRVVNEDDLNTTRAYALVCEWDCPHEVQNKANQDNIPLVSTNWVVNCLIESRVIPPDSHERFSFMYTEPE